jgi:Mg2+/Co2+ transporter CorB
VKDLMTGVAIASGVMTAILLIVVACMAHELGVYKGRLIQAEQDRTVTPIGIRYREGSE